MMTTVLPPDATLAEVLHHRAQHTPQSRLVIDIAGGAAVAAMAAWARPAGWATLASAAVCFASYGVWAWIDQALSATPTPLGDEIIERRRLQQLVAACVGLAAFVLFLVTALGIALGKIIS